MTWGAGDVEGELRHLCGAPLEESFEESSSSSDEDTRGRPSAIVRCTPLFIPPVESVRSYPSCVYAHRNFPSEALQSRAPSGKSGSIVPRGMLGWGCT